jgi:hypothetical protein
VVSRRPGEAPACAGTDFIIARDGRIAAVYLFFEKLAGSSRLGQPEDARVVLLERLSISKAV